MVESTFGSIAAAMTRNADELQTTSSLIAHALEELTTYRDASAVEKVVEDVRKAERDVYQILRKLDEIRRAGAEMLEIDFNRPIWR